ncbi:hypothetical protein J6590_013061 [Homalodisca vitripennis]|nr:hypothetical protein J6590_013061 [Homalodisca vitripennis]
MFRGEPKDSDRKKSGTTINPEAVTVGSYCGEAAAAAAVSRQIVLAIPALFHLNLASSFLV